MIQLRLSVFVDADTIETNGSAIGDHVIEQVKLAQQKGALLFSQIRIILESVFEKLFLTRFLAVSMPFTEGRSAC